LYGLEKFWAFLKYSRRKPKINPKLEEILKNYKRLEDFRVDGASFPQQFYPTRSGIIVKSRLILNCTRKSNLLFFFSSRLSQHRKLLQLQPLRKAQTVMQQRQLIHSKLVVTISRLVIVLIHDNKTDGQLPNDVKIQCHSRFLFSSSFSLSLFSSCCSLHVCKRYEKQNGAHIISMYQCLLVQGKHKQNVYDGISVCHLCACFLSRCTFTSFLLVTTMQLIDIELTAIITNTQTYFSSFCLCHSGSIYFFSLRMLVYVCLSVYILHQFCYHDIDRYSETKEIDEFSDRRRDMTCLHFSIVLLLFIFFLLYFLLLKKNNSC